MKTTLSELLSSGKPVIADGAMGSRLMAAGLPIGHASELWNVENPDAVREVHRSYIEAGSQIILTILISSWVGGAKVLKSLAVFSSQLTFSRTSLSSTPG